MIAKIRGDWRQIRLKLLDNPLTFALGLLGFALVTYGVFIFKQGFYWDDWPPILLSHIADKHKIWEYFIYDRPFQSWTYYFLFPVCKVAPSCWQFSAIFFRWLSALLLYLTFLRLFPQNKGLLRWAAVLFVVFPAFSNQYSSVSFGSHFIIYSIFAASLFTMVLGLQKKRLSWLFLSISYILTAIHLFSMEYFVGLEVLRFAVIFFLTYSKNGSIKSLQKTILIFLPFLAILGGYLYWRLKIYPIWAGENQVDNAPYLFFQLFSNPLPTAISFLQTVTSDVKFLFITSWVDRLIPDVLPINGATFWASLLIGLTITGGIYFLINNKIYSSDFPGKPQNVKALLLFGTVIIIFGLLPAWSTFRQITIGKWSDRYSISAMFGVSLIITALIYSFFTKKQSNVLLIILITLSVSYQIQLGNEFRKDYLRQKSFYTQLYWRIPSLEPGTAIYSPGIPAGKEADYSFSMGLNLLYSSQIDESLDYWFLVPRYVSPESLAQNPDQSIEQGLRNLSFSGSGNKVVSIQLPDQGCLWVINQYYALIPKEPVTGYSAFSNESLISSQENKGEPLIGSFIDLSPQNMWCYYFEKIDLARSKNDYSQAINLYLESVNHNLKPVEGVEYLPIVQSYAALENFEKAIEMTNKGISITPASSSVYCGFWKDFKLMNPNQNLTFVENLLESEMCKDNL